MAEVKSGGSAVAVPTSATIQQPLKKEIPVPFRYQFIAGAVAGVTEVLIMYPLDVIKTRLQLQSTSTMQYRGMVDCARRVAQTEGIPAFYRGILAPIFMEAPKSNNAPNRATKFAANGAFGEFYRKVFKQEKMDQKLSVLTGASAGVVEACVICPFEVVKLRMQNPANAQQYRNFFHCCAKLGRKEGLFIFFQGFESTLWRSVVFNAGYFGCIFQIRSLLPRSETRVGQITNDLVAGSVGGTVGVLVNTPFDVIKSRIQSVQQDPCIVRKYNWAFPALAMLYREEGIRALYKGLIPKMMRFCPGGGILLVVYTAMMELMTPTGREAG